MSERWSLSHSQRRLHTGRSSTYVISPRFPPVLVAFGPMRDENREEASVSVGRGAVAES